MPFSLLWVILSVQSIHWGTNNLRLIHQQLGLAYVGILDNTIFFRQHQNLSKPYYDAPSLELKSDRLCLSYLFPNNGLSFVNFITTSEYHQY